MGEGGGGELQKHVFESSSYIKLKQSKMKMLPDFCENLGTVKIKCN